MSEQKGLVFDVQGFSVHDGPGCRTLIFLKGCTLNCGWCANPEGINPNSQVLYYRSHCKAADYGCMDSCPRGAIVKSSQGVGIEIDRRECGYCKTLDCVKGCNHDALRISGEHISVDEMMMKIQRDRRFWGSRGGMTLTGGEPLLQREFATEILRRCHEGYIHTSIETCGQIPWETFEGALPYLDWIFFDLKHMDSDKHEEGTGQPNGLILENARRLASTRRSYRLIFRMPVIPGFNDDTGNIRAIAEFIAETGMKEVNVLPIHYLGLSKYDVLGVKCFYDSLVNVTGEKLTEIQGIFREHSVECYLGSSTPF
jgi:glycyl-radical enzyme activating protein